MGLCLRRSPKNKTAQAPDREFLRRPPENFGFPIYVVNYFAGAFDVVEGVVDTAFLCFFVVAFLPVVDVLVALFAAGAGDVAGAAGVCAIEMPAIASVRESPRIAEVIFFMMFVRSF
jgi:hypothetical protein